MNRIPADPDRRPILLLFGGQGSQRPGMGRGLYDRHPTFTGAMDDIFDRMGAEGRRIRSDWLSDRPAVPLDDASRAQPLLFAVNRAVGLTLAAHGLHPDVLLGHSIGELAAAALAGVFDTRPAAELLLARSAATAACPAGGMLAVAASVAQVRDLLREHTSGGPVIAAVNAPRQTVLAGRRDELNRARDRLATAGVIHREVAARQPFHSPAMSEAVAPLARVLGRVALRAPRIAIQSTRTARRVSTAQAQNPEFWAEQIATPVLFWPALDALLRSAAYIVVECAAAPDLATTARLHPAVRRGSAEVRVLDLPTDAHGAKAFDDAVEDFASGNRAAA